MLTARIEMIEAAKVSFLELGMRFEFHPKRRNGNDEPTTAALYRARFNPASGTIDVQGQTSQTGSASTGAPQTRESNGRACASKLGPPSYQSNVFLGRH
jgi:hypothetical protein